MTRRYKRPSKPSILDKAYREQPNWRERAACRGADLQLFFPNANTITKLNKHEVEKAYSYCERCPVAGYCMYEALINDYDGIWARSITRQRNAYIHHYFPNSLEDLTPNDAYLFYRELCGRVVDPTRRYKKRSIKLTLESTNQDSST